MGCGGSADTKVTVDMQIQVVPVQCGIIEFDQIFQVLAETLGDAEVIRANAVPGLYNMIHIVKAHKVNTPSLSDAYTLWTWGLSACNEGKLKGNGCKFEFTSDEEDKFDYKVGISGEFRFDWFGDYLNDFVNGVRKARANFPIVKAKADAMFERVKEMKSILPGYLSLFPSLAEKAKCGGIVAGNLALFGRGIKICEEFLKNIDRYENEINDLRARHQQIENEADQFGKQIFERWPPIQLEKLTPNEKTRWRMSGKMTDVVYHFWNGPRWNKEEQDQDTKNKEERAKNRPRKPKGYKPSDLPIEQPAKSFPFRVRWVGCNILDLTLQEMSVALEDQDIQMKSLKRLRKLIGWKLNLWELQDDSILNGWKIFTQALSAEQGPLAGKVSVKDEPPYGIGLDKLKGSDADLEEVRVLFLEYLQLASHDRRGPLDESWQSFNNQFTLLQAWSEGEFTNYLPFKQAQLSDQYNMMANVAKNLYALRAYKPAAQVIYEKGFGHVRKESETFWNQAGEVLAQADEQAASVKGTKVKDLAGKIGGDKKDAAKAKARKEKLEKFYNESKKKK